MSQLNAPLLSARMLSARLDRLPGCFAVWRLVVLLSLGGCFEFYDLFLTAYLSPALEGAGIFRKGAAGAFGVQFFPDRGLLRVRQLGAEID